MELKEIIASKEFKAVEHACKVGAFIAVSGFITTVGTELAHDKDLANFMLHYPLAALAFTLVNMGLAGIIKYLQAHQAELTA